MKPVVSNTSPLISLAGVGLLDLLQRLYTTVWITDVVRAEYVVRALPSDPDLDALTWLSVHSVTVDPALQALAGFGVGEATAITLAVAYHAALVILDDKAARAIARQRGLRVVGTLGILLAAKRAGLLPAVKPPLDTMVAQGRRISPTLRVEVLRAAGEDVSDDAEA